MSMMSELDYFAGKLSNILSRMNETEVWAEKVQLSIQLGSVYNEAVKVFSHEQLVEGLQMIEEMNSGWQDDDEVVTTFRSIKMTQRENYDAGFAAGVAWAQSQAVTA